jgi:DNA-directed RNA polymerase III subunit RPC7
VHKFFPRELYPTLGIEDANSKATNGKSRVVTVEKRLLFSGLDALNPLDDILEGGSDAEDENGAGVGEDGVAKKTGGVTAMLNDADDDADDADDDDEEPDDFTDDDEGDYNAEQYFDDGDDIGDDFGDDDGGDFF